MILTIIYILITVSCIVLTRRAQYYSFRYDPTVVDNEDEQKYVRNIIIGSYAFSFVPVLNIILLCLLVYGHLEENWKMLYLAPHQKRWVFRGSYQTYKGIGLGIIPFVLTENPRGEIPHPDDSIYFGIDLYVPFLRMQGTLTLKYRK